VLAVGAHPDDIELGCGATLSAHRLRGDRVALVAMNQVTPPTDVLGDGAR
jgi:LmbE family N-acetylglucosaminyl deacetylase